MARHYWAVTQFVLIALAASLEPHLPPSPAPILVLVLVGAAAVAVPMVVDGIRRTLRAAGQRGGGGDLARPVTAESGHNALPERAGLRAAARPRAPSCAVLALA